MSSSPNLHHQYYQAPSSPKHIGGYTLSTCIGKGNFSSVYKAHKMHGKYQVVAIKCITISGLSSKAKDNLVSEINILKRIKHEHVVSMKKFTWDAKFICVILEYCPGGTLAEYIKEKGCLSEFVVQHFSQQLTRGLQCLHAENIIHCDLKPENILLSNPPVGTCRNVKLKIADFGFSCRLDMDQKYVDGIKGSPQYMAPEVLAMKPYCSQADLYSLGIIIHECLFGFAPYKTKDIATLCRKILSSEPIKISSDINLSNNCIDLLEGLLVKNPEERLVFRELYRHPFIDIEHRPTIENYYKGAGIIKRGILLDQARNYDEARDFYIEGIKFLVPAYHWLDSFNEIQRKLLNKRIKEYCARAEQISTTRSQTSTPEK